MRWDLGALGAHKPLGSSWVRVATFCLWTSHFLLSFLRTPLASFFYSMFLIHGCGVLVLFWFVFFLCLFFSSMTLTRQRGV